MAPEDPEPDDAGYSVRRRRAPGSARDPSRSPWSREAQDRPPAAEPEPLADEGPPGEPAARPVPAPKPAAGRAERQLWPLESAQVLVLSPRLLQAAGLTAAVVYVLLLFDVMFHGVVARLDGALASVFAASPGWLSVVAATLLSLPGEEILLAVLLVAVAGWLARRQALREGAFLVGSMVGLYLVLWLTKNAVARGRPMLPEALDAVPALLLPSSLSFPSGHATSATFVWGAILVALTARPRGDGAPWRVDRRVLWGWIAVAAASGVARLVAGVHWPSDVLAGWALGLAWLAVTLAVWLHWKEREHALLAEDQAVETVREPGSLAGPSKF